VAGGYIYDEFIVAAAEILHERVTGGQDPRGPVAFQSAHRPQPGGQHDVDDLAVLVNGPVQVRPPARDPDICLVGEPPVTGGVAAGPRRLARGRCWRR
jgi:hypothetical protein